MRKLTDDTYHVSTLSFCASSRDVDYHYDYKYRGDDDGDGDNGGDPRRERYQNPVNEETATASPHARRNTAHLARQQTELTADSNCTIALGVRELQTRFRAHAQQTRFPSEAPSSGKKGAVKRPEKITDKFLLSLSSIPIYLFLCKVYREERYRHAPRGFGVGISVAIPTRDFWAVDIREWLTRLSSSSFLSGAPLATGEPYLVMEDSMSVKSMESVATSDEYEFVNEKGTSKQQQALSEPPMLKIANNGNLEDLQNNLREVGQVSACFSKAFHRIPRSMTSSLTGSDFNGFNAGEKVNSRVFIFEVTMEIKEEDGKGGFSTVPKDRNCFKLRSNVAKQVCLSIQQVSSKEGGITLEVERCFGVLVSPGRNVKHSDMRLLEMVKRDSHQQVNFMSIISSDVRNITTILQQVNTGPIMQDKQCYNICGRWDPADPALETLNIETPREGKTFMTIAVDLVIRDIREPVRFVIETSVKVFPQNERFWYFNKRNLVQQFYLNSKEVISGDGTEIHYEVQSIETSGELDRNRLNLALNLASLIRSPSLTSIDTLTPKEEIDSDGDEPMLSGTGEVSKDCSADELASWAEVLDSWQINEQRPKLLIKLTKQGIPEALRGEVWQRLSSCDNSQEMMDKYRMLITKESSCESVILRDINRTFPAHDFFKETGGLGQDSLYRISKAYAVHDEEVGYCQGLSFLVASLLLHMPEEQAFCVLVKLMYDYGLRDLYKDRFDNLYMRFYQLNRLIEDQLPELYKHFCDRGVETHMFAAQWFLTLFTARFPLYLVFHILDVFLLQGLDTLFQVALALLMLCKKELLQLDFESILKYFRVHLPKRCRNEEVARYVMKLACSVTLKKLKKYEAEFMTLKEAQENADEYSNEVEQLRGTVARNEEEKQRLEAELLQIKEMLQREVARADAESRRSNVIIAEYKQICQRLEDDYNAAKTTLSELRVCNLWFNFDSVNGELELELAQTKLAHVEAECRNQYLTHELHATASELQAARNSWPWLSKTLSSIKEAANKREAMAPTALRDLRRDSAPGGDLHHLIHSRGRETRDSLKEVV
ncbi:Rab GTPase-activating protein 1 [Acromyrmex echinatior]|uniref:Rab GTPase-activating protein 1 n=1 Tax=Acromyrmex echinatior TaxID=103372 RepID=F4WBX7_ACREC|nr:Rab GTPase-activating protein 1 [Acromyrmex echinatior]